MKIVLVRSRAIDPAVHKVAKSLSEMGHDVKLLLWDRKGDYQPEANLKYKIIRFKFNAPYDKSIVFLYLPIWWIYEFLFLLRVDAKIIHLFDFDTLFPAIFVKLIKNNVLFYTIYDFYADNLPSEIPNFLKKFVAFLERWSISFSEALFLVDEYRYKQVMGTKIKRIEYIYNSPPDYKGSFDGKKEKKDFNIFYAGIIHKSRGLKFIIEAIKNIEHVNFVIAGTGPEELYLKKTYLDMDKIKFIGQINYNEVIFESLNSDVIIALYDPELPNNKFASPNKLFEAMMCGKPIIINSGIFASKIVQKEKCGIIVDYGDLEELKKTIIRLRDDPVLCETIGNKGRVAYERKYSWNIMKKKLLKVYADYW